MEWMRNGRWSRVTDYGEGTASRAGFPRQPRWFASSSNYPKIAHGLVETGFSEAEVAGIMGGNWLRFFEQSFGAAD